MPARILFAEDDRIQAEIIRRFLERDGYAMLGAARRRARGGDGSRVRRAVTSAGTSSGELGCDFWGGDGSARQGDGRRCSETTGHLTRNRPPGWTAVLIANAILTLVAIGFSVALLATPALALPPGLDVTAGAAIYAQASAVRTLALGAVVLVVLIRRPEN